MGRRELEEFCQLKRRQILGLTELSDLTEQLAQAVDRRDQVSVQMMLSMRQEPLSRLGEADAALRARLPALPEETAIRVGALLNGGPAESPEEEPLAALVAQCDRLLKKVAALDRQISVRLGGKRSVYRLYREPERGG